MKNNGRNWIYQLPEPPEQLKDLNDYFVQYAQTKDEWLFLSFLHYYEPVMNRYASKFMRLYDIHIDYLADLKQIQAYTIWNAMQDYDPYDPIVLLQKVKYIVLGNWHDFARTTCGTLTVSTRGAFQNLLKVAKIYYEHCETMSEDDLTEKIAYELDLSFKTVRELIQTAVEFKYPLSLDTDPPESALVAAEDNVPQTLRSRLPSSPDAEEGYIQRELRRRLRGALKTLGPKDFRLVELNLGICLNCYQDLLDGPSSYNDIALELGYAGESSVEKRRKYIMKKLRQELIKQDKEITRKRQRKKEDEEESENTEGELEPDDAQTEEPPAQETVQTVSA